MIRREGFKMQEKLMKYKYYLICGAVILGVLVYQWWDSQQQAEPALFIESMEEESEPAEEEGASEGSDIMVDVKGAVKESGVYELQEGQRVQDAILMAGGFLENADERQINLAQILEDEMVIYVPLEGEEGFESMGISQGQGEGQEATVNINKATSEELQTISGIGPAKAEAIIQYREENGSFEKTEDITNVSGIGEKTFEKLKEKISVK